MLTFLARRVVLVVLPTLLGISILVFGTMRLIPGNFVDIMIGLGPDVSQEQRDAIARSYGLDQPLPLQYLSWLGKIVTGDLGTSARNQQPVTALLAQSIGPTMQLAFTAMLIALVIAVPVGIISAVKPGSWADSVGTVFALSGVAIPNFILGILLILLFSLGLRMLPAGGYVSPAANFGESLKLMLLPAFALGAGLSAVLMRQIRSAMLEVMSQDYVTTARSKGIDERKVVTRHALKNALIPVITVVGVQIGRLMGGTVVIETIFSVPGMGKLAVSSIFFRDFPVVQAVVLILGTAVLFSNLIADLLYGVVDPRVRYS